MSSSDKKTGVQRLHAERLIDGTGQPGRANMVVEVNGDRIVAVYPAAAAPANIKFDAHAEILTPGFIDIQINGALDIQFNDQPDVKAVRAISDGARAGGTAYTLPTFITAPGQDFVKAMRAVEEAIDQHVPGILGMHLEGPFLSKERSGIHPKECVRGLKTEDMAQLTQVTTGIRLITLAPEEQTPGTVKTLVESGAVVFAGHTQATYEQVQAAMAEGLSGMTHLFNAMSQITGRAPGVVGAALAEPAAYAGIIADGYHVHPANLLLAAKCKPDHLCLVTDAMLTLAGTRRSFDLYGKEIFLAEGRLTDASGTLAGAHLAMDDAVCLMQGFTHLPLEAIVKMATHNPASALGLADDLGLIKPGYRAGLTFLDTALDAVSVMCDGELYAL